MVIRHLLKILSPLCIWVMMIAFGYYAESQTEWGRSGHPSTGILIVIFTLIGSPLFAAVGIYLAAHYKQAMPKVAFVVGILINTILAIFGVGFWGYFGLSG